MDLLLCRLAGAPAADRRAIERALLRRSWLSCAAGRARECGAFLFPGGGLRASSDSVRLRASYAPPWIQVQVTRAVDYDWIVPRLLTLAAELGLGLDTQPSFSFGQWWWPVPHPATVGPERFARALEVSRRFDLWNRWPVLGLALGAPGCLELVESNPALGFVLATSRTLRGAGGREIALIDRAESRRALARVPRHEILSALGFGGTRSLVRLLARIPGGDAEVEWAFRLRDPLPVDAMKAIRHLRTVRAGVIGLAHPRLWPHVGPGLFRQASESPGEAANAARRVREMVEWYGKRAPERVGRIRDLQEVLRLYDEYQEVRAQRRAAADSFEAPAPVNPGPPPHPTPAIVPLRTVADLQAESDEMGHCIASYGRQLARGSPLFYRLLEPERATLSIRWQSGRDRWALDQLRGPRNASVTPETEQAVRDWLADRS